MAGRITSQKTTESSEAEGEATTEVVTEAEETGEVEAVMAECL